MCPPRSSLCTRISARRFRRPPLSFHCVHGCQMWSVVKRKKKDMLRPGACVFPSVKTPSRMCICHQPLCGSRSSLAARGGAQSADWWFSGSGWRSLIAACTETQTHISRRRSYWLGTNTSVSTSWVTFWNPRWSWCVSAERCCCRTTAWDIWKCILWGGNTASPVRSVSQTLHYTVRASSFQGVACESTWSFFSIHAMIQPPWIIFHGYLWLHFLTFFQSI